MEDALNNVDEDVVMGEDNNTNQNSNNGSSSSSGGGGSNTPLLFCEELMNIVERSCPGTRRLLSSDTGGNSSNASSINNPNDQYSFPPTRVNTLLHMFMVGDEDVPAKTCLALYAALDVAAGTDSSKDIESQGPGFTQIENIASDFA